MNRKTVNIIIDGVRVRVPEGTTIMRAAKKAGVEIPHLCYLEGVNEISACKVCVVEIAGKSKLVTACNSPAEDGMVIYTNSPKARRVRRTNVQLLLSQHDCNCPTCAKSGSCKLQSLSNDLGILDVPYEKDIARAPWDKNFPLIRDSAKCVKCMRCVQVCDKMQNVHVWDTCNTGARTTVDVADNKSIAESDCVLCGQCIAYCPTGALSERNDLDKIYEALDNPGVVTVVQVAPAVRAAWGEALGLPREKSSEGHMVAALKKIGFDYVFDTSFSADLTIMEEAAELVQRLSGKEEHRWPMFTSCCPGWVDFVAARYPRYLTSLSTAKSPQQMFGAVAKSYFAAKTGISAEKICSIAVMPCVSKKREATKLMMDSAGAGRDVDIVITTREFIRLIRSMYIYPERLEPKPFDSPLGESAGAGVIFGVTGGVAEAALRTAYAIIEGKNPEKGSFSEVRGQEGRKEAQFKIGGKVLKVCSVNGLSNARKLLDDIEAGVNTYDFVEVMACPGGCVGGGGQPFSDDRDKSKARGDKLYALDEKREKHCSHENPEIIKLYEEYFGSPLGEKAQRLLHVKY